jgi:hypothetical protein
MAIVVSRFLSYHMYKESASSHSSWLNTLLFMPRRPLPLFFPFSVVNILITSAVRTVLTRVNLRESAFGPLSGFWC